MNMQVRQHHTVDVVKASKLWMADKSAGEIAKLFGVSRNAIIGLAYRNREMFPAKVDVTNRNPKTRTREVRKREEKAAQEVLGPEATDITPTDYDDARKTLAKGLIDIGADECRFPLDNGHPFMFCAASIREGSVYCSHHHFRAYGRTEKK